VRIGWSVLALLTGLISPVQAEQPIFSEMPRWSGGYGVQLLQEYRHETGSFDGKQRLPSNLDRTAHLLHIEGVYTWHRSVRITAKIPIMLDAQRRVLSDDGVGTNVTKRGLGDPTLALPLKKYFNLDGRSGSWTIAPQLRIPGASKASDPIGIYFRELGPGLSVGYETETYNYIFRTGLSSFTFIGDTPTLSHFNLTMGLNFSFGSRNGHLKWEQQVRYWDGMELTYRMGPTLYLRWTDLLHFQLRSTHDVYEYRMGRVHGKAQSVRLGVGFVY